ncbi:MAG TPA: hypothetical protein VK172_03250 [Lentimicrobium sp.]|nr:hypothetical protein [Lentimicrobium sp.]
MENNVFESLRAKALLKKDIFQKTYNSFQQFRQVTGNLVRDYEQQYKALNKVPFELNDNDEYKMELMFGGDVLIFMLHTNIFQFPRMHEVMKTQYINEDPLRSYCGVINIYNFLADSFRYNRLNDLGYMIGRVFINRDKHFFIEGKREVGQLYHNFATSVLDEAAITEIIKSSILYTINFDLLTPPYDEVKLVRVEDMQATSNIKLVTGKRLGFRFQGDHIEIQE